MLEIITRLEQLDKPSRYEDCHLWVAAQGGGARIFVCDTTHKNFVWERGIDGFIADFRTVPKYTGSIDAAIGLAEKMLPDHGRLTSKSRTQSEPRYGAQIFFNDAGDEQALKSAGKAVHSIEAIALVIAVLRAVGSTATRNGGGQP